MVLKSNNLIYLHGEKSLKTDLLIFVLYDSFQNLNIFFTGCFSDSFLSNINTELYINVSMWKKAVGICQEICQRKNITVLAVKVKLFSYFFLI